MELIVKLQEDEAGWWIAECINLPGCITQGESRADAIENIKEAAVGWIEVMREECPDMQLPVPFELMKVSVIP
jgi:predicted RNase H-like HicB family nuclease